MKPNSKSVITALRKVRACVTAAAHALVHSHAPMHGLLVACIHALCLHALPHQLSTFGCVLALPLT